MEKRNVSVDISSSLFGLLGLILVILKLAGVEPVSQWSWWLVTLPWWLGLAVLLGVLVVMSVIAFVGFAIAGIIVWWTERK